MSSSSRLFKLVKLLFLAIGPLIMLLLLLLRRRLLVLLLLDCNGFLGWLFADATLSAESAAAAAWEAM